VGDYHASFSVDTGEEGALPAELKYRVVGAVVCVHCAVVCAPRNVLGAVSTGRNATYVLDARTGMECISSERGSRSASPRGAGAPGCLVIPAPAKKRNNHHTTPGHSRSPGKWRCASCPHLQPWDAPSLLPHPDRVPRARRNRCVLHGLLLQSAPFVAAISLDYHSLQPDCCSRWPHPRASSQCGGDSQVLRFWQDASLSCAAAGFRRSSRRLVVPPDRESGRRRVPPGKAREGREGCCGQAQGCASARPGEHGCPGSPPLHSLTVRSGLWRFGASALHRYQPYEGCRCAA